MDLFGNEKPVQIEDGEWWFNGRIIQYQEDSRLPSWISRPEESSSKEDTPSYFVEIHTSFKDAVDFALKNPVHHPKHQAKDYL